MHDMVLTPQILMQAYANGIFPMSESRDDPELFWVDPTQRGVMPLEGFHISRSLARRVRNAGYRVAVDSDFEGVIAGCADRTETWINGTIHALYSALFRDGHVHTVEIWDDDALVGGVYGLALGGAFFGESMFSRQTDTSKLALLYLVDRLREGGFALFDVQFLTPHLESLGAIEIPRDIYRTELEAALEMEADFNRAGDLPSPQDVLQRMTQTS